MRGGYIFLQSPVPDETFSPILPDADRHVLSVGLGYKHGGHRFDLAYALSLFEDRHITNDQNPAYNGDYSLNANLFGITYGYAF